MTAFRSLSFVVAAALALWARPAAPCTSILVTKGATVDGSTVNTYAADSHTLYGALAYYPAATHAEGTARPIHDWDEGHYIGEIPEARETYTVVGHMNEHQVSVTETTFGGRPELVDPTAGIDYGSLIFLALQRSRTAREAIDVMTSLVAKHGYRSEGETFSIADPDEVWLLEMVGKGPGGGGALWVARRVPDGYVTAHANQSRIQDFPRSSPDEARYAPDVVEFARAKGWFTGKDVDFRFADTYAPMTAEGLRFCEARVWSVFHRIAPAAAGPIDFVLGKPGAKSLPLWVKPERKLAVHDVMELMRDHFEGTPLDLSKGVGAGPFALPYRWRPLTWDIDGQTYGNERAISTQQTGYSVVAQARGALPDPVGGVVWFGVDDTYSTVYVPMYAGIREAPRPYAEGNGSFRQFTWDSAFWVFNAVANFAYSRYSDLIPDIRQAQGELEGAFLAAQPDIEKVAARLYESSPGEARDYLTRYSKAAAERVHARWRRLGEELLVKYLDGNRKDALGVVGHPGYSEEWRRRIVAADGAGLRIERLPGEPAPVTPVPVAGYFHSRDELGALAAEVPADFPFATEKLFLVRGGGVCPRPPRCCATAPADAKGTQLVLALPEAEGDACGPRDWLVRVPKDEQRPVVRPGAEH